MLTVSPMPLIWQLCAMFILAIPVACIAWTVTHEEVFREPREYCLQKSKTCPWIFQRKFFYLFTCEYCFSHYVTAGIIWMTNFTLLMEGWRGHLLAFFSVVWIANIYMGLQARLRIDIRAGKAEADIHETVARNTSTDGDAT
jgi:hypothetical protein